MSLRWGPYNEEAVADWSWIKLQLLRELSLVIGQEIDLPAMLELSSAGATGAAGTDYSVTGELTCWSWSRQGLWRDVWFYEKI